MKPVNKKRMIRRIAIGTGSALLLFLITVTGIVYWKQDSIVQHLLEDFNKDFKGNIRIEDSHIALFENFPYISIDLEKIKIHENKECNTTPIAEVNDVYIGFDLWTIINGKMEIKKIKLKNGSIHLIQHPDGEFNIIKALSTNKKIEDANEEFHLDLKQIELENIDLNKLNESNQLLLDTYIYKASSTFKTSPEHVLTSLDADFELNIVSKGDTSFIKHKHFTVNTDIDFLKGNNLLTISPTVVKVGGAEFNMEGTVDFDENMFVDLKFEGNKPNFDLLIALAPEEMLEAMNKYENKGKIYFNATVKGSTLNGNNPAINATFGCKDAYFNNQQVNKKLDEMNFAGYFTNGEKRDLSTMEIGIENFSARPEIGIFSGNLKVKNFTSPDIQLQIKSDFELDFLAKFFNLKDLEDLKGKVALTMNFHDIIDPNSPEKAIEKLNESYFTELKVENLSLKSPKYHLPLHDLDLYAHMSGHEAIIEYFNMKVGKSDVSIHGTISDLPAIIHHTGTPVTSDLQIKSKYLDLYELTGSDTAKSFNEQIENLSMGFKFKSSAKAFTESPHLPVGDFFVENLYAKLKHYPHTLHDFHADILIQEEDFRIVDFKGMIDKSDFFFSGKLRHYDLWFAEHPAGDTRIEFNLVSNLLQLEDLFAYKGENYVPKDYRHEEFRNLKIHGYTDLHFKDGLKSVDFYLDRFDAKMKIHPMHFENFNGRVHYESEHLIVENFSGKLGKSDFKTTLHYYFGKDENIRKRDNHFELTSTRLDFDELFNYNPPPATDTTHIDHDAGFNIYELPFTNMTFDFKIDHLNYHRYLLHHFNAKMRTTTNHYLYIDKFQMEAAGGSFDITGYFNGSNPKLIYFSPKIKIKDVDLEKLLIKFDNFGQDHLVSENLRGKLSGKITGKIHMHTDLVPKIDDSELHMDLTVTQGKLLNYSLLECMSDYFSDKNLKVVRFDTLSNHLDLKDGVLSFPNMTINSSIGFMQISGKQDMNLNMEYYIKVPWQMVTQSASSKLFGKKTEEVDPSQVDAIQYANPDKKTWYLNLKIKGNVDDYKISLGKK